MNCLQNLACTWVREFQLMGHIWTNRYPNESESRLAFLEKSVMSLLVLVRALSLSHLQYVAKDKTGQTQLSELYALIWFIVLLVLLFFPFSSVLYVAIIGYRLIDAFNYRLCIIFVDRYGNDWSPRSLNRVLLLLLLGYFEMIIGFAALYTWAGSIGSSDKIIIDPGNSLYFSIVTITTLGYGDFSPTDALGKFLVSAETLMGVVYVILVLAAFISGISGLHRDSST